jgi:hypothetical protein
MAGAIAVPEAGLARWFGGQEEGITQEAGTVSAVAGRCLDRLTLPL